MATIVINGGHELYRGSLANCQAVGAIQERMLTILNDTEKGLFTTTTAGNYMTILDKVTNDARYLLKVDPAFTGTLTGPAITLTGTVDAMSALFGTTNASQNVITGRRNTSTPTFTWGLALEGKQADSSWVSYGAFRARITDSTTGAATGSVEISARVTGTATVILSLSGDTADFANTVNVKIGGTTVINSSRKGFFAGLDVATLTLQVGGVTIVDASRNCSFVGLTATGNCVIGTSTPNEARSVTIMSNDGYETIVNFTSGLINRWATGKGTTNQFFVRAYTAAGALIDTPISIGNAAGSSIVFSRPVETTAIVLSNDGMLAGTMAANDKWRIIGSGATDVGELEIATADNGEEPIVFRQYSGDFSSVTRTLTLLNSTGNSTFPGQITATSLILTGNILVNGTAVVDSSRNGELTSLSIGGVSVINSTRNATFVNVTSSGLVDSVTARFGTTATSPSVVTIRRDTSSATFTWGVELEAKQADASFVPYANIRGVISSNTTGSATGGIQFNVRVVGTVTTIVSVLSDGLYISSGSLKIGTTTTIDSSRNITAVRGTFSDFGILRAHSEGSGYRAIYPKDITPASTNYVLAFNDNAQDAWINGISTVNMATNGVTYVTIQQTGGTANFDFKSLAGGIRVGGTTIIDMSRNCFFANLTASGNCVVGTETPNAARSVTIMANDGYETIVNFTSGLINRWVVGKNASNNFVIRAYTAAGALIDTPIEIANVAGGAATVSRPIVAPSVRCTSQTLSSDVNIQDTTSKILSIGANRTITLPNAGSDYSDFQRIVTATGAATLTVSIPSDTLVYARGSDDTYTKVTNSSFAISMIAKSGTPSNSNAIWVKIWCTGSVWIVDYK